MNVTKPLAAILTLTAIAALASALPAEAQTRSAGAIADSLTTQTGQMNTFVTVLAFVIGVVMAIMGFLKFKAHSDNPNDPSSKLSTAFMLVFVGAALVAIPAALGAGIQTVFGDTDGKTNATTGFSSVD